MKTRFEASSRRAAVLAALILAVPALSRALPAAFEDPAAPAALVSRIRALGVRSPGGVDAISRGPAGATTDELLVIWAAEAAYVRVGDAYDGFKADLLPDFRTILPGISEDGLNLLKGFKFHMTVDRYGETTITTEGSVVPEDMQETLNTLVHNFENATSIVMQEWSGYHSVQLLPQSYERFTLVREGNNELIDFRRGTFDIHVTLSKNNAFIRLEMASPAARKACSPTFMTTEGGFLFSSSECTIVENGKTISVKMALDYQTVSGLKLPSGIDLYSGVDGRKPGHMPLSLVNPVILRR